MKKKIVMVNSISDPNKKIKINIPYIKRINNNQEGKSYVILENIIFKNINNDKDKDKDNNNKNKYNEDDEEIFYPKTKNKNKNKNKQSVKKEKEKEKEELLINLIEEKFNEIKELE